MEVLFELIHCISYFLGHDGIQGDS